MDETSDVMTAPDDSVAETGNGAGDGTTGLDNPLTRAIQTTINEVPLVAQPSDNTCWATVATMMLSWHDGFSYTVDGAMARAGSKYQDRVKNDQGLSGRDKPAFLSAIGLRGENPQDYTVEGFASLIDLFGPLWITTDESPDDDFAIHARIVTSMFGDGTIDGTMLEINDPADGRQHTESYNTFLTKYDQVAFDDIKTHSPMRVQVVHF